MSIIISAHTDVVRHDIPLRNNNGTMVGLLDNLAGVICMYSAIYSNQSIQHALATGDIKIFHNRHEEFAYSVDFPEANPETDFVINVDVCAGDRYKGKDAGIENLYGKGIADVLNALEWEGFKFYFCEYTGDPEEGDEMDQWAEKKIPGLSFIIPIDAFNDNWHGEARLPMERMNRAILMLQRLICYLL
jgi:hypothetical protein